MLLISFGRCEEFWLSAGHVDTVKDVKLDLNPDWSMQSLPLVLCSFKLFRFLHRQCLDIYMRPPARVMQCLPDECAEMTSMCD
jgi:hypothetical protein